MGISVNAKPTNMPQSTPMRVTKPTFVPKVQVSVGKPEWNKGMPRYQSPAHFTVGSNATKQSDMVQSGLRAERSFKSYGGIK